MNYFLMKLIIPREICSREDGRYFLKRLMEVFPDHIPGKFGFCEPLKDVFDQNDLSEVLHLWESAGLIAERKKYPGILIDIGPSMSSPFTPHRSIFCALQFKTITEANRLALREFLYEVSNTLRAIYSTAHMSVPEEAVFGATQQLEYYEAHAEKARAARHIVERLKETVRRRSPFISQLTHIKTKRLRESIHNIFWLTVFGPPYLKLFGEDRIRTAQAYEVRKLAYGGIGVQLTQSIDDSPASWQEFVAVRDKVKLHLGSNAFKLSSVPKNHVYNVPDFGIPKDLIEGRRRAIAALSGETGNQNMVTEALKRLLEKG